MANFAYAKNDNFELGSDLAARFGLWFGNVENLQGVIWGTLRLYVGNLVAGPVAGVAGPLGGRARYTYAHNYN